MTISAVLRDLADKIDQGEISGGSSVLVIDGRAFIVASEASGYSLELAAWDLGEALLRVNQLLSGKEGA